MMTRLLLPLLGLALALPAAAQRPFTADDAMARAQADAPRLAAAGGRRLALAGQARSDAALPNPLLEWRRENIGSALQRDEFFTLYLPLDITGRRLALRQAAGAADARGVADSVAATRDAGLAAGAAWWRTALARALAEGAQAQAAALDSLAAFDALRLAEGAVAEQAAIRTQVEADRARLGAAAAFAEWQRQLAELAQAIGVAPAQLPEVPALDPAQLPTDAPITPDSAAIAAQTRPELAAADALRAQATARSRAEGRGLIGDLTMQAGTKLTAGVNTKVLGASLPLPLLSQNGGGRTRARGERLIADADRRDLEIRLAAEATAAARTYAALATARPAGALAARADDLAVIALTAYREGAASLLDVLDAQRARIEARAAALRWTADLQIARLVLRHATGAPLRSEDAR